MAGGTRTGGRRDERQQRRRDAERLRAQARAAERRRNLIAYGAAGLVALLVLAVAIVPPIVSRANAPENQAWTHFGVRAAAAGCTDVTVPADQAKRDHVTTPVTYSLVPPAGGPHFNDATSPDTSPTHFFGPSSKITVESYVHNLEHGYLVVWYAPTLRGKDLDALKGIAAKAAKTRPANKVKIVPWPAARGAFPAGKEVALTAWGHEQTCDRVSGPAVQAFADRFPVTQAPEPASA